MKHTKGPWKVIDRKPEYKKNGLPEGVINPNLARFWIGAGKTDWRGPSEVCAVHGDQEIVEPIESEANAHLIASAPELLEALNSIFLRCTFTHVDDWQELRREIGELAGQAIAKAERGEK